MRGMRDRIKCGCKIKGYPHSIEPTGPTNPKTGGFPVKSSYIVFCPLHAAAEELLIQLEKLHDFIQDGPYHNWKGIAGAEEIIAKANAK